MIKKVLAVSDFRVFQNWQPDAGAIEFERVNLLYGINGSGKSTLATLLGGASSDDTWTSGLKVTFVDDEGAYETVQSASDVRWRDVRVFNREYVSLNLQFDLDGRSTTEPLLILGQKQIDRDEKIKAAQARRAEIVGQLPKLRETIAQSTRAAGDLATRTAREIAEQLNAAGPRYAARSYDARQVKQLLTQKLESLESAEITRRLETVNAPRLGDLVGLPEAQVSTAGLADEVRGLLMQTATAQVIESLNARRELADWAQAGLALHQVGDNCAFCGADVTAARVEQLNKHFDDSVRRLQTQAHALTERLRQEWDRVRTMLQTLPQEHQLQPELRSDYTGALANAEAEAVLVQSRIQALAALVEAKGAQLFAAVEMPVELPGASSLDLTSIQANLDRHRELSGSADARVRTAAMEVERARAQAISAAYVGHIDRGSAASTKLEQLTRELAELDVEIVNLGQEDLDATPLAESLNSDLARLLGREDLTFVLVSDGGYHLRRNGKPAVYLSEGEKTAISLLYFLKSLDAHDCDRPNTIVIIDDPVSSLDSNVVAGISAHLWSKLVGQSKCKQVFLLTHNFELFRSWSNSLDRLGRPAIQAEDITFTTQELRIRTVRSRDGLPARHPYFLSWPSKPKQRTRIRSEYHYLFWRVADTLQQCQESPTLEAELDAASILPNACRRLLEGFLSFKFPDRIGDFRGLMMQAIETLDAGATRTRLVTFLHAYSHNEEGDISKGIPRPESINILSSVFELIRHVDLDHYSRMCAALGVDIDMPTV